MSPPPSKMCVAADTATFRCRPDGRLEVLLIERGCEPYKGCWALPGGFVEREEDLPDAAGRELQEETGLTPRFLSQLGAWGTPGRDPRGRTVSAVYVAGCGPEGEEAKGADDAARAEWHPAYNPPELAFDHRGILSAALPHLRDLSQRTHAALALCPIPFNTENVKNVLDALKADQPGDRAHDLLASAALVSREGEKGYRPGPDSYLAPLRRHVPIFTLRQTTRT